MEGSLRRAAVVTVVAAGVVAAALVGGLLTARAGTATAQSIERASILPCATCVLSSAPGTGAGYTMTGSGITDYWLTAKSGTIDFVFFVDPGHAVTQNITFALWAPGETSQPLTEYTFKHARIPVEGLWFQVPAQGNYSTSGVYTAAVYAQGQTIGFIPVVLSDSPSDAPARYSPARVPPPPVLHPPA